VAQCPAGLTKKGEKMQLNAMNVKKFFNLFLAFMIMLGLALPTLEAQAKSPGLTSNQVAPAIAAAPLNAPSDSPVLLVYNDSYTSNKFGRFLGEIMKAEGFNLFDTAQLGTTTTGQLSGYDTVVLAETSLTSGQTSMFQSYVQNGGNLIAMRPDAQLNSVFGLGSSAGSLNNAYVAILTNNSYGQGFTSESIQTHSPADQYTGVTSQVVALLYSNASTATAYPAVVVNNYGSGKAAAFTYDVARSVAYIRQGNPNQINVDADGDSVTRIVDMYYNWIDLNKMPLPQADIHQRLFAKIIGQFNASKKPLPRFWYFPNAKNTVSIITSDAHANPDSYYQNLINGLQQYNAPTSFYMAQAGDPSPANVNNWTQQGFSFGIHPYITNNSLSTGYDNAKSWYELRYGPLQNRTTRVHQVRWEGWVDGGKVGLSKGMAMDYTYYRYGSWLQKPDNSWARGYVTGSGLPMKLIDENGLIIDYFGQYTEIADDQMMYAGLEVLNDAQGYQVNKQAIDVSETGNNQAIVFHFHVDYYGGVGAWVLDTLSYLNSLNIPIFNGETWLNFTEKRYNSNFSTFNWAGNQLSFSANVPAGQSGQTVTIPVNANGKTLSSIQLNGSAASYTTRSVRGENFAFLTVPAGISNIVANYTADTIPPVISNVTASPNDTAALIQWNTNELATSTVEYGTSPALGSTTNVAGFATSHSVNLTGLTANTTYHFRVVSVDQANNSSQSSIITFTTLPPGGIPPTINTVSPSTFDNSTARTLTITGSNFQATPTVKLGNTTLASVTFVSSTQLTSVVPAGFTTGLYSLSVTNPGGATGTLPNAVTVNPPLGAFSVSGVSPNVVSNKAANLITISGNGFVAPVSVTLGGTPVSGVTLVNNATITFNLPQNYATGTYDLQVTNGDSQTSTLTGGFTVLGLAVVQTLQSEFVTGTNSNTRATRRLDGEVKLALGLEEYFNGTTLDSSQWISNTWGSGGTVTAGSGVASVSGAYIRSANQVAYGKLQGRVKFTTGVAFQHFGFANSDFSSDWIIFSVPGGDTSRIYARTNLNGVFNDTPLSVSLDTYHDFLIETLTSTTNFYVDGQLVHTQAVNASGFNHVWLSAGGTNGTLSADTILSGTYPSSGTFTSSALDAGSIVNWTNLFWQGNGTATIQARTSTDGTNWSGWSTPSSSFGTLALSLPTGRYLQYQLNLSTADPAFSPEIFSVAGLYTSTTPPVTVTTISPNSGSNFATTNVTISGSNFASGATAKLGNTSLTNVVFVNDTQLTATVPSGLATGVYTLTVTNPNNDSGSLANAFQVTALPLPVINYLTPNVVSNNAAQQLTIKGANFVAPVSVALSGNTISGATLVDASTITFNLTSGYTDGSYNLQVTNGDGQNGSLANGLRVLPPAVVHTTQTNFAGGTSTNTVVVSRIDGEVKLNAPVEDYFNGTVLNPNIWTTGTWTTGGGASLTNGTAVASGGYMRSVNTVTPNRLEGRVKFESNKPNQHFGYSPDLNGSDWLIFSIPGWDTSQIYARTSIGGSTFNTPINVTKDLYHDFVIEVNGGTINYYVDGSLLVTHTVANPGAAYIWLSSASTTNLLALDSVKAGSYTSPGSYLSAAMDAGTNSTWSQLYWEAAANGGTVTVQARTSTNGTNWSAWSTPTSSTGFVTLSLPAGRYLQYQLDFSTADTTRSPEVLSVAGIYSGYTPGPLASIALTPSNANLTVGTTQQFTAQGYDSNNYPLTGITYNWSTTGGGTINASGLYTAGSTAGSFPNSVVVASGNISATASITLTALAPTVSSVSPTSGHNALANTVTINGANFQNGATVNLGTTSLTNVTFVNTTQVTATVQAGIVVGTYGITVTNPDNLSATLANAYTVTTAPAPTVTAVSPTRGSNAVSTNITITGTNFLSTPVVQLFNASNTYTLTNITFVSATNLTATVPSGYVAATYSVRVTNPGGLSGTRNNAFIVDPAPPTISSVNPSTGDNALVRTIAVYGTGFYGTPTVRLNTTNLSGVQVISPTLLTANVGANFATGVYTVTVINPDNLSATRPGAYTVTAAPSLVQNNNTQFGAGTFSNTALSISGTGVSLNPSLADSFSAPLNASRWSTGNWATGGTSGVSGGVAYVRGSYIRSVATYAQGVIEGRIRFSNTAGSYQNFGWANDLNNPGGPWALFGVPGADPTGVYARTNMGGQNFETRITGISFNTYYTLRIQVEAAQVRYYLNNTLVATHNVTTSTPMYAYLSSPSTASNFQADWIRVNSHPASGTFTGSTMTAGGTVAAWGTIRWSQSLPTGTGLSFQTQTSTDNINWSAWSNPVTTSGSVISSPAGQYIRYRINMTTTNSTLTPLITSVTITYTSQAPVAPFSSNDSLSLLYQPIISTEENIQPVFDSGNGNE
jgi:hypothetical protein